jgi:hypothetical protein
MIATDHGVTPWSCQDVRNATGCCLTRATAKLRSIADRIVSDLLDNPARWSATGRTDRIARAITELLTAAGPLAAADPQKFRHWLGELIDAKRP